MTFVALLVRFVVMAREIAVFAVTAVARLMATEHELLLYRVAVPASVDVRFTDGFKFDDGLRGLMELKVRTGALVS